MASRSTTSRSRWTPERVALIAGEPRSQRRPAAMRPAWLLLGLVLLLGVGGASFVAPTGAQDATAPAGPEVDWGIPGFEALSILPNASLASGMTLELDRITWESGFSIPMHTHPANDAIWVLSGQVAWAVEQGTAEIRRAAVAGTPGPTGTLSPGGEAILGPGDAITFDYPSTGLMHAARVVGDEPVVMLIATIFDPTVPLTVYAEEVATPTP